MDGRLGTVVLDAGAVIGLGRGNPVLRARLRAAQRDGATIKVPVVVIAETVRGNGPRDASVNRVLAACAPHDVFGEATARVAGALLADARSDATIDAFVVADALRLAPSVVLTGDPADLRLLLGDRPGVVIEPI